MRQDNPAALDAAFRLALDLADITEHQGWRTAHDQVLAALAAGPCLVALLGPAGTGKTLLLRGLTHTLRAAGRSAALVGRGDMQFDAGEGEVTLVDEAARMDEAALDQLALPGVAAVLADLPSLEERLDGLGVRVTVVRLAPLQPGEVGAFVADRLARAGQPAGLLTDGAVEALAAHSAGVPRVLNLLARAALFMAETEGAPQVEPQHVDQAVALREGGMPEADALGKPPEIWAHMIPDEQDCAAWAFLQTSVSQAAHLGSDSEAEPLPPVSSADPIAPAALEVVTPEPPPAAPETTTPPAPSPRPRIRTVRLGAALLAASVLLIASLAAGWSLRPHLAQTLGAALAGLAASPSPAPDPPEADSPGDQSP
jgi:hypothetical protein